MSLTMVRLSCWLMVILLVLVVAVEVRKGLRPERGGGGVADVLLDAADPAVLHGEHGDLRVVERASVRPGTADLEEDAHASCAVGHEGPRHWPENAGGELGGPG